MGKQNLINSISDTANKFSLSPYLEFKSNREVLIEGNRGILEYTTEVIRINTGNLILVFSGRDLNIKCISASGLIISGFIISLEFLT